jgi:hypothetical protein
MGYFEDERYGCGFRLEQRHFVSDLSPTQTLGKRGGFSKVSKDDGLAKSQ